MTEGASQITSLAIVYSAVYSGGDQRKHQSSASLAFVRGFHRRPVKSPRKGPVTRKMFPFDDVIMFIYLLIYLFIYLTIYLSIYFVPTIGVDLIDDIEEFLFRGILSQGPHDDAEFLRGDRAVTIFVKRGKRFTVFCNRQKCTP